MLGIGVRVEQDPNGVPTLTLLPRWSNCSKQHQNREPLSQEETEILTIYSTEAILRCQNNRVVKTKAGDKEDWRDMTEKGYLMGQNRVQSVGLPLLES